MSKFQHLVVDTTAFIKNVQLQNIAENCYTIQGVLDEIRNDRQIRELAVLPYNLRVKQPDPDIIAKVAAFAKKTGDFASLSLVDLQVIALTYELETVHVGSEHLHEEPKSALTVSAKVKPAALLSTELTKGFYLPKCGKTKSDSVSYELSDEIRNKLIIILAIQEQQEESGECCLNEEKQESNIRDMDKDENGDYDYDDDDDDDHDVGWITVNNIAQAKRDYGMDCLEQSPSVVACITTDFAMQNVLKQIGLQVAALDGRVIRRANTYILRCYACFKTTPDSTKVFCPRCGNRTLKKVAVSLDEHGQQMIHINSRRPLTAKYKNQPVAKFSGGKHATNPLLYEDQPLPQQRMSEKARSKTNALGDDYTAGYSPFVMRDVDSRSAVRRGTSNLKQWLTNCEYDNKRRGYRK